MKKIILIAFYLIFFISCDSPIEPETNEQIIDSNTTFETAEDVSLFRSFDVQLYPSGDIDYFHFSLDQKKYVTISVDSIPFSTYNSYSPPQLLLFNSDLVPVDSVPLDRKSLDRSKILPAGEYYLLLRTVDSTTASEDMFSVKITYSSSDKDEVNDSITEATPLFPPGGSSYDARIFPMADVDYYSFTIEDSDSLSVVTSYLSKRYLLEISIIDNRGRKITGFNESFDYEHSRSRIDFALKDKGTYYLKFNATTDSFDDEFFQFFLVPTEDLLWKTFNN